MIICEPVCKAEQHVPVNAAMIKKLTESQSKVVLLMCACSHWEALKKVLSSDIQSRIVHYSIDTIPSSDDWKGWWASFKLLFCIKKLKHINKERLVFLSTTTGILGLNHPFLKEYITSCVFHMVLARVDGYVSKNPFRAWFSLHNTLLRFHSKHCKIIVLEEHVLSNLTHVMPHLKSITQCVLHPLPIASATLINEKKLNDENKIICFPGGFTFDKGANLFCDLGELNNGTMKLVVAGKLNNTFLMNDKEYLFFIPPAKESLSRREFSDIVNDSDFLFLGHNPSLYKWIASGVYIDALVYEKPIIAKRSAFFESEFSKYGEFGFLFDDIEELNEWLLNPKLSAHYKLFKENIKKAKSGRELKFSAAMDKLNDIYSSNVKIK